MASSGTFDFGLEWVEVVEEAFERIGIDPATLTARHTRAARRSANLMFVEWANKGVHLWTVDQQTQALTAGDASYDTPAGTVAILEMVVRRNGIDTPVHPMGRDEYLGIPDKTTRGLPNRFYFDRHKTTPNFTLWNVPENATDQILYYRIRQIQDVGGGANNPDVPYRWLEAVVSGLTTKLAEKYAPERESFMRNKAGARFGESVPRGSGAHTHFNTSSIRETMMYSSGRNAIGFCRRCGEKRKLRELRTDGQNGLLVCPNCWDMKHPSERPHRVDEGIGLRHPAQNLDAVVSRAIPAEFDMPLTQHLGWQSGTYFGGGT